MHVRDYIYIKDAIKVTLEALHNGDKITCNVGTGKGTSVKDIFNIFYKNFDSKLKLYNKPERVGELGKFYCNIDFMLKSLSIKFPFVQVNEGIKKTLKFYNLI